jgi:superfamily II DNA or RNA helicase
MARLTRRGFEIKEKYLSEKQINSIHKNLRVTPKIDDTYKKPEPFNVYVYENKTYILPLYWALEHIDSNPKIRYPKNDSESSIGWKGLMLRPHQINTINALRNELDAGNGKMMPYNHNIITMGTGMGKTVISLYYMCMLRRKTLIVTHTEPLQKQWIERIESNVSGAKLGYIKGKKYKIEGCNIVLAKVQSLMKSTLPLEELLADFDFVIYDEAHHYASNVFSRVLNRLAFPYALSLTATFERKDKLERVLNWFLGKIAFRIEGQLNYDIAIKVIQFNTQNKGKFKEIYTNRNLCLPKMMNNLCEISERNDMIVKYVKDTLDEEPYRHILLVSHRIDQIKLLKERFNELYPNEVAVIAGKSNKSLVQDENGDEVNPEGKKIVLGIYNLASEGLDISTICCVILVTPMSEPLQVCGRMLRRPKEDYIHIPTIVDITDQLSIYKNMHYSRLKKYKKSYLRSEGSTLKYYNCNDETNFNLELAYEANLNEIQIPTEKSGKYTEPMEDNPFLSSDED